MSTMLQLPVAAPPATPLPAPAPTAGSSPPARLSPFNRGFLDRKDPLAGNGMWMRNFSFAMSYRVTPEKHEAVLDSLFHNVHSRLRANCVPQAVSAVVDYDDAGTGNREAPRRYVVVRSDTVRGTHMDVFATFRSYGDYLYVSVDSFVLPRLSVLRLLWEALVMVWSSAVGSSIIGPLTAGLVFGWMAITGRTEGMMETGEIREILALVLRVSVMATFFLVTCPVLLWRNREVIRGLSQHDPFGIAMRRRFHRWTSAQSAFDGDDILAHFKSTVSLIAEEISAVFEKNGIPVEALNYVRQVIHQTTTVVNSGVMNVMGSFLVGVGNTLTGEAN
jgi:hypothetical protein